MPTSLVLTRGIVPHPAAEWQVACHDACQLQVTNHQLLTGNSPPLAGRFEVAEIAEGRFAQPIRGETYCPPIGTETGCIETLWEGYSAKESA
jgi:hypothetical protein